MSEQIIARTPEKFIGTAAERAGMSTTGILPGSLFYEDTGKKYRFDGTTWREEKKTIGELPVISATALDYVAKEFFVETDLANDDYTFSAAMGGLSLVNDGDGDITVAIGSLSFIVKPGESYAARFDNFTEVTITSAETLSFRAYGLGVRA